MNDENLSHTKKKGYNGYYLTKESRKNMLSRIEPLYSDVISHHVTHEYNVYDSLPPEAYKAMVIAVAYDYDIKVQAAVVTINGMMFRPEGNIYHVTISIDRKFGATPAMSNEMIQERSNWEWIKPFNVDVIPRFFPFYRQPLET